jgi:1-aminocyclopropane-1-carboxylate deaminase/D-cysteine desulfhydrase-like pyridoxal-dependent ACC family enzyme
MVPKRIPLIQRPTPLHRLDRMSAELGIDLWIKRDDLTGFAFGGNKGRKLEFLMGEAVAVGADAVVTCGASQSNFVRQLGAACSRLGIRCVAVVMDLPFEPEYGKPEGAPLRDDGGNLLLDDVLGVELRRHPDGAWEELFDQTEEAAKELETQGRKVYRVPIGGSSPLGAYGSTKPLPN